MSPTIYPMDVVLVVKTAPNDIRVGDLVAYAPPIRLGLVNIIVHRVIEVKEYEMDDEKVYIYKTKGDANLNPDPYTITYDQIVGKGVLVIPKLGHLLIFIMNRFVTIILAITGLGFLILYKQMRGREKYQRQITTIKRVEEPKPPPLPLPPPPPTMIKKAEERTEIIPVQIGSRISVFKYSGSPTEAVEMLYKVFKDRIALAMIDGEKIIIRLSSKSPNQ